jgi:hypothetical protein
MLAIYAALVIIASLNRETGLLLVFLHAAYFPARWLQTALLAAVWGMVTLAIHLALGNADHVLGLVGTLQYNLDTLPDVIFANAPLIPLLLLVLMSYRHASNRAKRLLWITLGYVAAILVGGAWSETQRLILPVIPLIIPLIVYQNLE